ncbi:hypothetical protein [Streptomyces sp. NPDC101165]|uniref:hypothetical protein n=1 Tax=Streptomyces sp. NPDC101165 TaxID=3366119 RepID=UPI00380F7C41
MPVELSAVAAPTGGEFTCEAWLDDVVGISRWRERWTPVKHIDRVQQRPTIAAQEQTARIAGAGMKTDTFEGVV